MRVAQLAIAGVLFALAGCGDPEPGFEPIGDPLVFGSVYVNTSVTRQAQWQNNGAKAVVVTGFAMRPQQHFSGALPAVMPSSTPVGGRTPNIDFTFTPTQAMAYTGTAAPGVTDVSMGRVSFPVNALRLQGDGVCQRALAGLSVSGGNLVAGQALDFGNVEVGKTKPLTCDLVNASTTAMALGGGVFVGPFTVAPAGVLTVPANGRLTVTITFTPPAVGVSNGALHYVDTAPRNPASFVQPAQAGTALTGTGVKE